MDELPNHPNKIEPVYVIPTRPPAPAPPPSLFDWALLFVVAGAMTGWLQLIL